MWLQKKKIKIRWPNVHHAVKVTISNKTRTKFINRVKVKASLFFITLVIFFHKAKKNSRQCFFAVLLLKIFQRIEN